MRLNAAGWRTLYRAHASQSDQEGDVEEFVFDAFRVLHERFDRARSVPPSDRLIELRYEDLVRRPAAVMADVYDRLALGSFAGWRTAFDHFAAARVEYQVNRYDVGPDLEDQITRRSGAVIERQRYPMRRGATRAVRSG